MGKEVREHLFQACFGEGEENFARGFLEEGGNEVGVEEDDGIALAGEEVVRGQTNDWEDVAELWVSGEGGEGGDDVLAHAKEELLPFFPHGDEGEFRRVWKSLEPRDVLRDQPEHLRREAPAETAIGGEEDSEDALGRLFRQERV